MLACIEQKGENLVKNPLDSVTGTVCSGLVITIVLFAIVKATGN
jgi:hypothetical protein